MTIVDLPGVGESGARDTSMLRCTANSFPGSTWCCG
jgi:predicted GTPase